MRENIQSWVEKSAEADSAEEALACLDRALELDPEYHPAHSIRGTVLRQLGRHAQALKCFQRVTELQPTLASAHQSVGVQLLELDREEEAIAAFTQATHLDPLKRRLRIGGVGKITKKQGRQKVTKMPPK